MTIGVSGANGNLYFGRRYVPTLQVQQNENELSRVSANDSVEITKTSSEQCTDGKDDGKIGFFSAIGNAVKGIGKTIVNGVKGMFTGKDGKFSLGKTLLSIGAAAACIIFPAVGLAACCVGAAAGAVQVGKGIYNAAKADTDAEAKMAWQDIGGGTFTAVTSAVGAKACYGAMKSTSSVHALDNLSKDASIVDKGKALFADAKSSTVNRATALKSQASNMVATHKEVKELNALRKEKAAILKKQAKGEAITTKEQAVLDKWDNLGAGDYSAEAYARVSKRNQVDFLKSSVKEANSVKEKAAIVKEYVQDTSKVYQKAKSTMDTLQSKSTMDILKSINIKALPSRLQTVAKAINTKGKYAAIQEYGYATVAEVLKAAGALVVTNQSV